MCGICGYWAGGFEKKVHSQDTVRAMADAIGHRGPDSSGATVIEGCGPAMAHRRLSVIDTGVAGLQPMTSPTSRFVIVYNGEIYNHLELRQKLGSDGTNPVWRGHSDTETILACFEAWGVETSLERMVGMFAFAVWDRALQTLILARDRLGEKPLYYGTMNGTFLFSSELKSLHRHPEFRPSLDRNALTAFVKHSYVPGPHSIYEEIKKLQPGRMLIVTRDDDGSGRLSITQRSYWSLNEQVARGIATPFIGSESDAVQKLRSLLMEVIGSQMASDVPLGAFLSGGIDSSLVTAMMQNVSSRPVRTFSIGFEDRQFDESESARAVAEHIGTDHVELIVTPEDLMQLIPRLPEIYCEPFGDSSQLPTFLVSELARKHVTVALTGDGADELFGGYNRYMAAGRVWRHASRMPVPVRTAIGKTILSVPRSFWDRLFNMFHPVLPRQLQARFPGEKIQKIGKLLKQRSQEDYLKSLISMTEDQHLSVVVNGNVPTSLFDDRSTQPKTDTFEHWMMAFDTLTYLPDDICVKVDRASMANSLETRAPYLDKRIVEFAWTLPLEFKIRERKSKWILRQILAGYVPRELFERPKMGFGVPFAKWLRGPMRDWAEDLLREEKLREAGFFDPAKVRRLWVAHLQGKGHNEYLLWNILMFNSWLERWER